MNIGSVASESSETDGGAVRFGGAYSPPLTIKTRRYKACSKYANYTSFNKNDFPKVKLTLIMHVALPYRQQI